jgi:geranylgeranyl diphosphate synthase, type I
MTATLPKPVTIAGDLVQPALRHAVAGLDTSMRHVVSYHLGWVDEHGEPVAAGGGGKALRPALTLLSAQAAGVEPERAVPGAAAVELVHNFSLLHDDVMDGDLERRHRPTAWRLFGVAAAILAGDALLTLAVDVLQRQADSPTTHAATACLTDTVQRLIAGQSADVAFERRSDVTLGECLAMAAGKNGALMRCAMSMGAILAGASPEVVDALAQYGAHLGLSFQLVDDLLGIWGSPEVTGKPVLADLRVRKRSVPVVAALTSGTPAGDELRELYLRPDPPGEDELHQMADLVERAGGLAWTEAEARKHVTAAGECLGLLDAPAEARDALWQIALFVTERDR